MLPHTDNAQPRGNAGKAIIHRLLLIIPEFHLAPLYARQTPSQQAGQLIRAEEEFFREIREWDGTPTASEES